MDRFVSKDRIYPSQCACGHVYIEQYKFKELTEEGSYGFCWCGWCRNKRMLYVTEEKADD